jgi:putative lipoic acid-binding regulatory protein
MSIEQEPNSELCMTFPCSFPLKVMGTNNDTFETDMVMITRKHIPDLGEGAVRNKLSKTGKYLALTITFTAHSKAQLDDLYSEINEHPDVKMVL